MFADLLHQVVKCSFHGRRGAAGRFLHRHLPGGQAQVERDRSSLARRILFHNALQMHQFRAEHLQPFAKFLDLVVDVFFDVGSFAGSIAYVDIHLRPRITEVIP